LIKDRGSFLIKDRGSFQKAKEEDVCGRGVKRKEAGVRVIGDL
jgi:hypothetical protein